jgi:hypothetical protein
MINLVNPNFDDNETPGGTILSATKTTTNSQITLQLSKPVSKQAKEEHCHVQKNDIKRNVTVWRKLITVLILCILFMVAEIVGGILAHSISIQTDAAHMAADIAGFFFSIVAIYVSGKGLKKKLFNFLIKLKMFDYFLNNSLNICQLQQEECHLATIEAKY